MILHTLSSLAQPRFLIYTVKQKIILPRWYINLYYSICIGKKLIHYLRYVCQNLFEKACSMPCSLLGVYDTTIRLCSQAAYIPREGKRHLTKNSFLISSAKFYFLLILQKKMFKVRVIVYKEILLPLLNIIDSGIRMSSIIMPHHSWRILVIV